jgi:hypothetical protein
MKRPNDVHLGLFVSKEEREFIDRLAKKENLNVSNFIRFCINQYLNDYTEYDNLIIEERKHFDWDELRRRRRNSDNRRISKISS